MQPSLLRFAHQIISFERHAYGRSCALSVSFFDALLCHCTLMPCCLAVLTTYGVSFIYTILHQALAHDGASAQLDVQAFLDPIKTGLTCDLIALQDRLARTLHTQLSSCPGGGVWAACRWHHCGQQPGCSRLCARSAHVPGAGTGLMRLWQDAG